MAFLTYDGTSGSRSSLPGALHANPCDPQSDPTQVLAQQSPPSQLHSSVLYAASHIAFPASEHFLCEHQLRECVSAFLENVHERSMRNFEQLTKCLL